MYIFYTGIYVLSLETPNSQSKKMLLPRCLIAVQFVIHI